MADELAFLADCVKSLPPQESVTGNPENPRPFLGVARLDYRSPAFAGKAMDGISHRQRRTVLFPSRRCRTSSRHQDKRPLYHLGSEFPKQARTSCRLPLPAVVSTLNHCRLDIEPSSPVMNGCTGFAGLDLPQRNGSDGLTRLGKAGVCYRSFLNACNRRRDSPICGFCRRQTPPLTQRHKPGGVGGRMTIVESFSR